MVSGISGIIQRQDLIKFEKLLYSHWSDWNIPIRLIPYFNWNKFLIYKLDSFCQNFKYPLFLMKCLQIIYESLKLEMVKIDKEREVIDKLMAHYEASSDFEGWFPEWLWDRRTKNRLNSGINISAYNRVYTLMKMLKEERTIDYFIFQL